MCLDELISTASGMFENSDMPVAITDHQLDVVWANPEAARRFPGLRFANGLVNLIQNYEPEQIAEHLKSGKAFVVSPLDKPLNLTRLMLLPILDGELVGSIVLLFVNEKFQSDVTQMTQEKVINSFSNEYKMPLTIIFSTLGLMARSIGNDDTMRSYIKLITQNCYRLFRTFNNLIEITRLDSGTGKLDLKNGDISSFTANLCKAAAILTAAVDIPLTCEVPDRTIITAFDPTRLSGVFFNLFSNSCKYTRPGNSIRVRLEESGGNIRITVSDKGMGVRDEHISQIFDPYFSYDPGGRMYAGNGLGLAIVKNIIRLHGGTVAVQSRENEGTRVAFTLPVHPMDNLPDYIAENSVDYLSDRFSTLYIEMSDVCGSPMP